MPAAYSRGRENMLVTPCSPVRLQLHMQLLTPCVPSNKGPSSKASYNHLVTSISLCWMRRQAIVTPCKRYVLTCCSPPKEGADGRGHAKYSSITSLRHTCELGICLEPTCDISCLVPWEFESADWACHQLGDHRAAWLSDVALSSVRVLLVPVHARIFFGQGLYAIPLVLL